MSKICRVVVVKINPDFSEEICAEFKIYNETEIEGAKRRADAWIDENAKYDCDGVIYYAKKE